MVLRGARVRFGYVHRWSRAFTDELARAFAIGEKSLDDATQSGVIVVQLRPHRATPWDQVPVQKGLHDYGLFLSECHCGDLARNRQMIRRQDVLAESHAHVRHRTQHVGAGFIA